MGRSWLTLSHSSSSASHVLISEQLRFWDLQEKLDLHLLFLQENLTKCVIDAGTGGPIVVMGTSRSSCVFQLYPVAGDVPEQWLHVKLLVSVVVFEHTRHNNTRLKQLAYKCLNGAFYDDCQLHICRLQTRLPQAHYLLSHCQLRCMLSWELRYVLGGNRSESGIIIL